MMYAIAALAKPIPSLDGCLWQSIPMLGSKLNGIVTQRLSKTERTVTMPNIICICGSLRNGSYNRMVMKALPRLAPVGMSITEAPSFLIRAISPLQCGYPEFGRLSGGGKRIGGCNPR